MIKKIKAYFSSKTTEAASSEPSEKRAFTKTLHRILHRILDVEKLPFYFLLALLLLTIIECLSRRSLIEGLLFPFRTPIPWLVNYGIILLTLQLALFFRRRVAVVSLISAVWLGLGIAECILLSFRVTPLTAIDFSILGSVIDIIGVYLSPLEIVLLLLLILSGIAAIVALFVKMPKVKRSLKKCGLSLLSSAAALALIVISGFQINAISDSFPNLSQAYKDYGFAYCFSLSLIDKGVEQPNPYSEESVERVLSEVEAGAFTEEKEEKPNVILVQLESFFDVNYLKGLSYSENPLPHFTYLKSLYENGLLTVPVIGAGTVNTEFEVLSGMRVNDFGPGEYPYKTVLSEQTCESIAYNLLASGYRTHALHNHQGTFYDRHEVYKNLGFETFTPLEHMLDPTYNSNEWAKDAILTSEILNVMNSTAERDFVFAVSVQGHGKYPTDYRIGEGEIAITGGLEDEEELSRYQYYINQLYEMDAFIGALYEEVMAYEEPTVLVFYGDHLPSLSLESDMLSYGDLYTTEYLLLSNYETKATEEIGDLYAYQLFPVILERIGNNQGLINRFHRVCRNDADYNEKLALLEYDLLYGERYAYGQSESPYLPVDDMAIGTRPITIDSFTLNDGILTVTGENFTPYSTITLDGDEQDTVFVDRHTLTAVLDAFDEDFVALTIRQLTTRKEMLSESERVINGDSDKISPITSLE